MIYRHLYRDQHENSIVAHRLQMVAKLLNALRIVYLVLSAIVLGFAVVSPSLRLQIAAGIFFGSSFALQFVRDRMKSRAERVIRKTTQVRY